MAAEDLDKPRKERLRRRVASLRFVHGPRCQLQVNVLERLQPKERRGFLVRRAIRDVGSAQMVEDDLHAPEALCQTRNLRQTSGVRLQADGQAGGRAQLPGWEGPRI